ncbi:hypothetical protein ABZ079_24350 [Streptomyces sp. NPDC006314]|uniref:hypothetical protein n=1 Tax=Streptomyces sp. NPDC006314 TaxID=3154475 RepID=UPI0033A544A0
MFTIGSGLYLTAGVLYFTEAVDLPAGKVGLGLGIAGCVALALGIAGGHLADRRGARGVYAGTLGVQALATAAFTLAHGFWSFVLVVSVALGAKGAGVAARSPLIRHYGGELWHAAAGFEVSFALAPDHATGQYLGVFGLGAGLAEAFGPGLLIALRITWGGRAGTSWASCSP